MRVNRRIDVCHHVPISFNPNPRRKLCGEYPIIRYWNTYGERVRIAVDFVC